MTGAGDPTEALDALPADSRDRLEAFTRALDRIDVDDTPLYVARVRQPRHRRAVETAELVAIESGLAATVAEARRVVIEAVIRQMGERQFRVWVGGVSMAPNMGPVDERVRIASSLGDAVTALVLGDRLEAHDAEELLGLWARLVP
jgi:hypothetical protein